MSHPERLLHLIWLGFRPQWVSISILRWAWALPVGWEMKVWDESNAPGLNFIRSRAPHLSLRGQADLVRIEAIRQYGGVYMDMDTIPLRTDLLDRQDSWIGAKPVPEGALTLINAHFGLEAGHPMLDALAERAREQLAKGVTNDHFIAGPRTWRTVWDAQPADSRPTLVPHFPTLTSGPLTRLLPQGESLDLDSLRKQYPEATALHVIYSRKYER